MQIMPQGFGEELTGNWFRGAEGSSDSCIVEPIIDLRCYVRRITAKIIYEIAATVESLGSMQLYKRI